MSTATEDKILNHCFRLYIEAGEESGETYSPEVIEQLRDAFHWGWLSAEGRAILVPDDVDMARVDATIADGEGD